MRSIGFSKAIVERKITFNYSLLNNLIMLGEFAFGAAVSVLCGCLICVLQRGAQEWAAKRYDAAFWMAIKLYLYPAVNPPQAPEFPDSQTQSVQ